MFKKKRKPMATKPWRGARPVRNTARALDILNAIAVFTVLGIFYGAALFYMISTTF